MDGNVAMIQASIDETATICVISGKKPMELVLRTLFRYAKDIELPRIPSYGRSLWVLDSELP